MAAILPQDLIEERKRLLGSSILQADPLTLGDLDAVVADEPNHQPQLRRLFGSSALTESWKPSTTVQRSLMTQSELSLLMTRKGLIHDHREIRLYPYLPNAWVDRAGTFLTLGYGELAAADAYRSRLLCDAVSTDACRAWKEGDGSLTDKVVEAIRSKVPRKDVDMAAIGNDIRVTEEIALLVMAQGLIGIRAWYDAISVLEDGLKKFPASLIFSTLLVRLRLAFEKLKQDFTAEGEDSATVQKTAKRGRVDRVAYPWIAPEELTRGTKALKKVKAKIQAVGTNVGVAPSDLGGTTDDNYGLFAKCDIDKNERILLDISIYSDSNVRDLDDCSACSQPLRESNVTVDCCKAKFCTEACKAEAVNAYHRILCGKDFTWLYAACKDADGVFNDEVPLLMVKVLATAVQQNAKPLKVACVGTLKAGYHKEVLSYFKLFHNVIAPTRILQTLGVDIFTDVRFDPWCLQTLFLRIENNKHSGKSAGGRVHSGVNPLFSMINHDCYPSATWHSIHTRGAIEVAAIRPIKKGEEICVSYIAPWMTEAERRERIMAHIGKMCECGRCVLERETAMNGGRGGEAGALSIDIEKIRRDVTEAQVASRVRLARER